MALTTMSAGDSTCTSSEGPTSAARSRSFFTISRRAGNGINSSSGESAGASLTRLPPSTDDHAAVGVLAFACGLDPADLTGGIVHDLPLVRAHGLHALGPARAPNAGGHRPGPLDQLAPAALPVVLHVDHHPAPGLQLPLDGATDHHPDPHDSLLRAEAQQPLLRLLDDLDPGLLLADAELFEGGLDGLLNACGASFDFLHCASSCPRSSWFQLACPTGGSCPTYPSAPRSTPVAGRAASPAAARSATGSWSPSRPARRPRC